MSFRNFQDTATLHLPFPISRKRLQDICEEYERNKVKVYVSELVDGITCEIVETARKRPPLVLYPSSSLKIMFRDFPLYSRRIHYHFAEAYISEIVRNLRTRFPDSTITVNSADSYLLVDWS